MNDERNQMFVVTEVNLVLVVVVLHFVCALPLGFVLRQL